MTVLFFFDDITMRPGCAENRPSFSRVRLMETGRCCNFNSLFCVLSLLALSAAVSGLHALRTSR